MHPYRCLSCSHRFVAPAGASTSRLGAQHPWLTLGAAALVIGVTTIIVSLLWRDDSEVPKPAPLVLNPQSDAVHPTLEAARGGDPEAQFRVGRAALSDTSRGKEGTAEALTWLKQAADGGHSDAMLQLGKLYRSGYRVPQNYDYAEKWVRAAAEAGNSEAMVELGRMYRAGLGVKPDAVKAYVWFNRAAAAMNMDGAHERDIIGLKLSADELKAAQTESLATEEALPRPAPDTPAPDTPAPDTPAQD